MRSQRECGFLCLVDVRWIGIPNHIVEIEEHHETCPASSLVPVRQGARAGPNIARADIVAGVTEAEVVAERVDKYRQWRRRLVRGRMARALRSPVEVGEAMEARCQPIADSDPDVNAHCF